MRLLKQHDEKTVRFKCERVYLFNQRFIVACPPRKRIRDSTVRSHYIDVFLEMYNSSSTKSTRAGNAYRQMTITIGRKKTTRHGLDLHILFFVWTETRIVIMIN